MSYFYTHTHAFMSPRVAPCECVHISDILTRQNIEKDGLLLTIETVLFCN